VDRVQWKYDILTNRPLYWEAISIWTPLAGTGKSLTAKATAKVFGVLLKLAGGIFAGILYDGRVLLATVRRLIRFELRLPSHGPSRIRDTELLFRLSAAPESIKLAPG
jgi:hypothetical protein